MDIQFLGLTHIINSGNESTITSSAFHGFYNEFLM